MATCDYCGLEADVAITSDNKHTYPELECRFFQKRAGAPGWLQMFHKVDCPTLQKLWMRKLPNSGRMTDAQAGG
jgi:hypothetical protein